MTASQSPQAQRAVAMHASMSQIATMVAQAFATAWGLLSVGDLRATLPQVIAQTQAIVGQWGDVAAVAAAEYYAEERMAAGIATGFTPALAPAPTPDQVEAEIKWATKGLWSATPDVPAAHTLSLGATAAMALSPGRDTIIQAVQKDKAAVGWARITDGHPCAFCAMIASRGPVYKSEQSAGFEAHDHCQCSAAPFFSKDDASLLHSKQLYEDWKRVTDGHSGKSAIRAWRSYWDKNAPQLAPLLIAA